ncbi:ATP-binding cassette domain-containing protein [Candidatus Beckwithbacteria bacterium]|nr:ATP-binding cassette domain-containing protein [Candidatus Beckwithbacteria bacterium]
MSKNPDCAILVSNLVKKFKNFTAVNQLNFCVKKGEIFAFLGPNGAGKTTTIKILTTLSNPTSGQVLVDGFNPQTQENQVRKSFGIVFQDSSIDEELTAYENMDFHGVLYGLPNKTRKLRIQELLEMVDLADRQKSLVKTFSGGMKRRLEIARGLLHNPSIFFLDEPTLGLDPQTRNKIWDYIKKLNHKQKTTVFFTTHYMEEAERYADRIGIIDHGELIAIDTADNLKRSYHGKTLEDVFLKLTGRQIRPENGETHMQTMMRMQRQNRN